MEVQSESYRFGPAKSEGWGGHVRVFQVLFIMSTPLEIKYPSMSYVLAGPCIDHACDVWIPVAFKRGPYTSRTEFRSHWVTVSKVCFW